MKKRLQTRFMSLASALLDPESREYIRMLALLFGISFAFGVFAVYVVFSPSEADAWIASVREEFGFVSQLRWWELFALIFANNAVKAFVVMLGGLFFGLLPIVFIFLNGYLIGMIVAIVSQEAGVATILFGTVPHGIIEIPAVIIAAGYGVFLGERMYYRIRYKTPLTPALKNTLRRFGVYIVPLLFVAALIETTLSLALINLTT